MSNVFYNEIDTFCCKWLHELMGESLIEQGKISSWPIQEIHLDPTQMEFLKSVTHAHFFAGIGGWAAALRLANWPDSLPIWTGSCPCQPFSIAGNQIGLSDSRHLWPYWYELIKIYEPPIIVGEQVKEAIRLGWCDQVQADLEKIGYSFAKAVLPARSVNSDHKRDRLYFVADSRGESTSRLKHIKRSLSIGDKKKSTKCGYKGLSERVQDISDPNTISSIDGIPRPVGIVRGFGNAIVPQVAARFLRAYLETL